MKPEKQRPSFLQGLRIAVWPRMSYVESVMNERTKQSLPVLFFSLAFMDLMMFGAFILIAVFLFAMTSAYVVGAFVVLMALFPLLALISMTRVMLYLRGRR